MTKFGYTLMTEQSPPTSLVRYAVDLRAMTSGAATFTRGFSRYDAAPG